MKATVAVLLLVLLSNGAIAQSRPPIIDMHLHANSVDSQGPPPVRICAPIIHMPMRDASWTSEQYADVLSRFAHCDVTLVSPTTDEQLMEQTLEVLERRNVYAVTSGAWEWVRRWNRPTGSSGGR